MTTTTTTTQVFVRQMVFKCTHIFSFFAFLSLFRLLVCVCVCHYYLLCRRFFASVRYSFVEWVADVVVALVVGCFSGGRSTGGRAADEVCGS